LLRNHWDGKPATPEEGPYQQRAAKIDIIKAKRGNKQNREFF